MCCLAESVSAAPCSTRTPFAEIRAALPCPHHRSDFSLCAFLPPPPAHVLIPMDQQAAEAWGHIHTSMLAPHPTPIDGRLTNLGFHSYITLSTDVCSFLLEGDSSLLLPFNHMPMVGQIQQLLDRDKKLGERVRAAQDQGKAYRMPSKSHEASFINTYGREVAANRHFVMASQLGD